MTKSKPNKSENLPVNPDNDATAARAAVEDLDRLFHEQARLGIMTAMLASSDGLNFKELKTVCDLTDGNLNRHLKVLVEMGVLNVKKTGRGRNTNSLYRISAKGRRAFQRYLETLETIVNAAKKSMKTTATTTTNRKKRGDGLSPALE